MNIENEVNNQESINLSRLMAIINIVLFILPSSVIIFGFFPIINGKILWKPSESNDYIYIIFNPFVFILISSFILSLKYFITKKISKFSEAFLILSIFANFLTNLIAMLFILLSGIK